MRVSHIAILIIFSIIAFANSFEITQSGSAGCGKQSPWPKGDAFSRFYMDLRDENFAIDREVEVHIPDNYDINTPAPILYYFHGHNQDPTNSNRWFNTTNTNGAILVYPRGMSDFNNRTDLNTWNVGLTSEGMTKANQACFFGTKSQCYATCNQLSQCGQCNWGTCFDDIFFITSLMYKMNESLCVDQKQVYGSGVGEGAMMIHHLTGKHYNLFTAVYPINGLPLRGFSDIPDGNKNIPIMQLHGDKNVNIPY